MVGGSVIKSPRREHRGPYFRRSFVGAGHSLAACLMRRRIVSISAPAGGVHFHGSPHSPLPGPVVPKPRSSESRSKIIKGPVHVNTPGPFDPFFDYFFRYLTIRATISETACSIPTNTARAMTLCPMFNSSISGISTIG